MDDVLVGVDDVDELVDGAEEEVMAVVYLVDDNFVTGSDLGSVDFDVVGTVKVLVVVVVVLVVG